MFCAIVLTFIKGGPVKKFNLSILTLLAMIIGLSACNVKTSNDRMKDLEKQWDEDKRKNDELLESLKKSLEQGGQPGSIKVSGIIVKDNQETDVRITVVSKAGIGKDGTQPPILDSIKPVFSSKTEVEITKISELKTLISLGCDAKTAAKIAKERSLKIEQIPSPSSDVSLGVVAKVILLCKDLDKVSVPSLTEQFLIFIADEVILDKVDYTLTKMTGSISLHTNKLMLKGPSKLATKGTLTGVAPIIQLSVAKEISSDQNGKILLMSTGADYKADVK